MPFLPARFDRNNRVSVSIHRKKTVKADMNVYNPNQRKKAEFLLFGVDGTFCFATKKIVTTKQKNFHRFLENHIGQSDPAEHVPIKAKTYTIIA